MVNPPTINNASNPTATSCGLYCDACQFYTTKCAGCKNVQGQPFWTPMLRLSVCPLYRCCVVDRHLEHCGLCSSFPCEQFMTMETLDPNMSPDAAMDSAMKRHTELVRRRKQA